MTERTTPGDDAVTHAPEVDEVPDRGATLPDDATDSPPEADATTDAGGQG